jgi:hypothetical protein
MFLCPLHLHEHCIKILQHSPAGLFLIYVMTVQVLLPPQGSLLALLRASPEYSTFLDMVTFAEMEQELEQESR